MATFQEVILKALSNSRMGLISLNQNMLEVAMPSKKNPAYVKTAVTDELAQGLMQRKKVAFIIYMDGDEINEFAAQIDAENVLPKAIEPTETAQAVEGK